MGNYGLRVYGDLCVGCPSCATACQANKDLGMGVKPITIEERYYEDSSGDSKMEFILHACRQCEEAPCIEACPSSALIRVENGVVVVDDDLCYGCELCVSACPYGTDALSMNPVTGTIAKCDLCLDRLENGRLSACVQACPAKVIYVGEIGQIEAEIAERRRAREARRSEARQEAEDRWAARGISFPEFDL